MTNIFNKKDKHTHYGNFKECLIAHDHFFLRFRLTRFLSADSSFGFLNVFFSTCNYLLFSSLSVT